MKRLAIVLISMLLLAYTFACSTHSLVIPDLAYVRSIGGTYSNDADPEPDAIGVWVYFYDSKSEMIAFKGIPVKVTVDIYAYPLKEGEQFPAGDPPKKLVHQANFTMDSTRGMGALTDERMSISFDDIEKTCPEEHFRGLVNGFYICEVMVETPQQGMFVAE